MKIFSIVVAGLLRYPFVPVAFVMLGGCLEFGKVEQGRVVEFDVSQRRCAMVLDVAGAKERPHYSGLPPRTFLLPDDPSEIGALPFAGHLLEVDRSQGVLRYFNGDSESIQTLTFTLIRESRTPIDAARDDSHEPPTLPLINRSQGEITLFLSSEKTWITIKPSEEAFALPDSTWLMGDEVRIYFKDPAKANRFMNVTQTDIFRK